MDGGIDPARGFSHADRRGAKAPRRLKPAVPYFRPRCSATAPPVIRSNSTLRNPVARISSGRAARRSEICGSIPARYEYASRDPEIRPPIQGSTRVEKKPYSAAKAPIRGLREFEDRDRSARFQHAQQFFQAPTIIREIAEAEGDGDQVQRFIAQAEGPARRLRTTGDRSTILRRASTSMGWQKSLPKTAAILASF